MIFFFLFMNHKQEVMCKPLKMNTRTHCSSLAVCTFFAFFFSYMHATHKCVRA